MKKKIDPDGLHLIMQERLEQISKHNRTREEDVKMNSQYQLAEAAEKLLWRDTEHMNRLLDNSPMGWDGKIWRYMITKPYKQRVIIAGALLAAELDRIQATGKEDNE